MTISKAIKYVRACAKEEKKSEVTEWNDDELIEFALNYLALNIWDAIDSESDEQLLEDENKDYVEMAQEGWDDDLIEETDYLEEDDE